MWYLVVCSLMVLCFGQIAVTVTTSLPDPVLNISQGRIVGLVAEDGDYYEFHGIPYADSTSGIHRFKAPRPAPSFDDTFNANRKDIRCVRALGVGYEGTEDCLVANVFTPTLKSTSNLPVMVWIKGKEFDLSNEPEFSFKHFVEKGVIVVSLNYRESILGYLCLGTEAAPGNAGLKDIIAGLRWVKDNIAQFGGNPESITLFGHGSGAAAVDLVTLSPMSNDLFHRAIAQSGAAIAPWAVTRNNLEYSIQVAEALGHSVTSLNELSEVFTRTSIAALMAVINELDLTDNSLAFAPCIERDLPNVDQFLLKSPYQTIVDGDFAKIPFITGYVDVEGSIRANEANDWLERMDSSFADFLQPDLRFENDEDRVSVANAIRRFYFRNQPLTFDNYLSYHGDTMMVVSAIREARLRSAVPDSAVYVYQFSYKGTLGDSFIPSPVPIEKAVHSEELAYLFYDDDGGSKANELDLAVSDILIERWTNFAKTGVPTSESSQVVWQPFTVQNPNYLRMLDDAEVVNSTLEVDLRDPYNEVVSFWNMIYEDHFLDALSKWQLSERENEDDEVIVDETEEEQVSETTTTTTTTTAAPEANSASTVVGCTFTIISLFAVLQKMLH